MVEEDAKKGTLGSYVSDEDKELEEFDEELEAEEKQLDEKEKKVIEAEVVDDGKESKWHRTVETDEGTFAFHEEEGKLLCKSGDNVYELHVSVPDCTCPDFQISKKKNKWCKHLKAASLLYRVKEFPKVPAEITKALAKTEKDRQKRGKAKKEELVKVMMFDKEVTLGVQVPTEIIKSEDHAVELIKTILGDHPDKGNVIMSYAGIEELSADVILSLSQAIGIRYMPIVYEKEEVKMSLGDVYLATANDEQKRKYEAVAKMLPAVNIVTHCRITTIAGWKDKSGNVRVAAGTKEEYLTPHDLADISKRSSAFLLTKCETKSAKKAILNCLPVTDEGLLQKIKEIYKWK